MLSKKAQLRLFGDRLIGKRNKDFWKRATGIQFSVRGRRGALQVMQLQSVLFLSQCKYYAESDRYVRIRFSYA